MKAGYVDIAGKWRFVFCWQIREEDLGELLSWLEALGATARERAKARKVIMGWNHGFTFSNSSLRMSVMAISKSTDREQFMNSIAHEIGHMKYDICVYYDVEDGSEEEMYLQGYIMQRIVAML